MWEYICVQEQGPGTGSQSPSPQGAEPRRMGMDTARGFGRQSWVLVPQGLESERGGDQGLGGTLGRSLRASVATGGLWSWGGSGAGGALQRGLGELG